MRMQRRVVYLGLCSISLVLIGFVVRAVWVSIEAEYNLQAVVTVVSALMDFIEQHERWPMDQAEFSAGATSCSGLYEWPRDADALMKRVRVLYGVPLKEVAAQNPNSFVYVAGQEPIYRESAGSKYAVLIEFAERCVATRQMSATKQGENAPSDQQSTAPN